MLEYEGRPRLSTIRVSGKLEPLGRLSALKIILAKSEICPPGNGLIDRRNGGSETEVKSEKIFALGTLILGRLK